jgi:hypothetical protein
MKRQDSITWWVLLVLLAAIVTQISLAYVHPAECNSVCDDPVQAPCPPGSCRIGEPRSGFPFPVVVDRGGSSPTSGWGKVGDWVGTDPLDRSEYLLRFYDSGMLSIVPSARQSYTGEYRWINDETIVIRLSSSGSPPYDYCSTILDFLQAYFRTKIDDRINTDSASSRIQETKLDSYLSGNRSTDPPLLFGDRPQFDKEFKFLSPINWTEAVTIGAGHLLLLTGAVGKELTAS